MRRNELIPVWDFKPAWKHFLFTWSFISAAFQNDPIFWWTFVGISFRVVFTWYLITQNEVSMTDMKSTTALSFKRTCALNATSSECALIHFVSGKLCSDEISCWFEISFRSKWPKWNLIPAWVHFAFHVNLLSDNLLAGYEQSSY